ncbi:hypothetical protein FQN60_010269 [Etheostoma spectabile]|uniref:Cadherin domain-containing protein n=1 Tax=Etheostoma spectabile TaxID=54343 RepID=A0A5J5D6F5_9PERO|nr:hypothetical protein FQN60_010269 [Etheostoma spectabile]
MDPSSTGTMQRIQSEKSILDEPDSPLEKPLDREKHEHISLTLTALDGGEPQLSGTMQILITVLDANDNTPVCSKPEYKASVAENAPVGTLVTTVRATDIDKGNNGIVTYMISKSGAAGLFNIDANNGVLTLIGHVDYEKRRLYELDVQVSDQGGLSDACKVIVDVTDTNDNPPSINIMSNSNAVSENMKPGTVVTMLNIQDADSNDNGKVMCVLNENIPFAIKSTANNFFTVVTDSELDREKASEYNITVTCSDEGVPSLSSNVTLTLQISDVILESPMEFYTVAVEITDINDNTPIFEKSDMRFKISESAVIGAKFLLERAIDPDVGTNGLQSYFLTKTENFVLKLKDQPDGEKTVEMILQKSLDREKQEEIFLVLTAVDGGEPSLSGTAQIHVTVLDVNDNAPVFTKTDHRATIPENAPKGTVITKVSASDADKGQNSKVTYSISNTAADVRGMFEIDELNGDLISKSMVDYEKARYYQIHVQASDEGGLTDSCKITVEVIDMNDNKPVINIMSQTNVVSEDSKPSTVVTMVNVQDLDSGDNGKVHCAINEHIPVTLKPTSNMFFNLLIDSDLDRETASEYNITVTCSDEGHFGQRHACDSLMFNLSVNCCFHNNFALKLHNNADGNKNVEIVLQKHLDREEQEQISLVLTAVDGGEPQMSGTMLIVITVLDANDNAPVFTQPTYKATVTENSPKGTIVATVTASDADQGSNAEITYSITNTLDNIRTLFDVTKENGEISIIGNIDFEKSRHFEINVLASDDGGLTDSCKLIVDVQDVNDNKPEINIMSKSTVISEDAKLNTVVTMINIEDLDSGENGIWIQIEKSILDEDEPDFPL